MPMYTYKCKKCEEQLDVLRKFDDYETPPQTDEYKNQECEHNWERLIVSKVEVRKSAGFGKKGHW